jgi:acylphosphatase
MTVRFIVTGLVQGVGFRYFTVRRAGPLGVAGWVTNLPDGRVEVVARGEEGAIAALGEALAGGPRGARVDSVEKVEISDEIDLGNTFVVR